MSPTSAGEVAQWLRVYCSPRGLESVPGTYVRHLTTAYTSVTPALENPTPSFGHSSFFSSSPLLFSGCHKIKQCSRLHPRTIKLWSSRLWSKTSEAMSPNKPPLLFCQFFCYYSNRKMTGIGRTSKFTLPPS